MQLSTPPDHPPRQFSLVRRRAERKARRPEDVRTLAATAYAKYRAIKPDLIALRDDLPTLIRLARSYATGAYRRLPWKAIVSVVAALIYFVMPFDAIPDFIPVIGYLDDAAVIAYVMRILHVEIAEFNEWEAR